MNLHRSKEDIQADIDRVSAAWKNHTTVINEGYSDGFNPYEIELEQLTEEWGDAVQREKKAVLSGDSLAAEKAWFNAQGFTTADLASVNAACLLRGYSLSELQRACKS